MKLKKFYQPKIFSKIKINFCPPSAEEFFFAKISVEVAEKFFENFLKIF